MNTCTHTISIQTSMVKKNRSWSQWKAGYERLCPRMLVDVHPENIKKLDGRKHNKLLQ